MDAHGVQHLRRVAWAPSEQYPPDLAAWPFAVPAVAQIIADGGLDVPGGVTFLVGENGSGKSTLVEAMAAIYPRRGAGTSGPGESEEDSPLRWNLKAVTDPRAAAAGFFLRAEAMHAYLAGVDASPTHARAWGGEKLQTQSHGESFLAVMRHRFADVGMYFMDEPEAALSFQSCLGVVALLHQMREEGSQVVVATHSPLLMSLPGATILEVGEWGIRAVGEYGDVDLVQSWKTFFAAPERYLRYLT